MMEDRDVCEYFEYCEFFENHRCTFYDEPREYDFPPCDVDGDIDGYTFDDIWREKA